MKFRLTAKWTGKLEIILCFPSFYYEELSIALSAFPSGKAALKGWWAGIDKSFLSPHCASGGVRIAAPVFALLAMTIHCLFPTKKRNGNKLFHFAFLSLLLLFSSFPVGKEREKKI